MSTRATYFYIITLVVFSTNYTAVGLKCYSCSSLYNNKCSEPIEVEPSDENYIESNCTTCAKIHVSRQHNCDDGGCDTEHAIYRSCLRDTTESDRCSNGHFMQIYGRECFCQTDLCNTGSHSRNSNILVNILVLFPLFLCYKYF